jgi:Predicted pPIWI-associating nuclease
VEALDTDFKKSVFDAALKSFEQSDNPLRLNNLATGLRELIRLVLRDLAPEADIKASSWYKPEVDKHGNEIITRPQRLHYAIHAGLPVAFVQDTLHVDVKKTIKDFSALNGKFSKFTNIEEATFGVDDSEVELFAEEALEVFSSLYETIEDCRNSTYRAMEEYAKDAVEDELFSSVVSELDQLATHYTVSEVNMVDLELTMDSEKIRLAIGGTGGLRLSIWLRFGFRAR